MRATDRFRVGWTVCAALVLAVGFGGCGSREKSTKGEVLPEGRYRLVGKIVTLNKDRGTLLISHEDIPGLMPAMTMEFQASPGDLATAREGMRIRGVIYQAEDGFRLEQMWPDEKADEAVVNDAAHELHQDTTTRGRSAFREVGEALPDFALYDQTGAVVEASRFHGKQIALNFIYTRCPDPNMCPASTMKMMQLQKMARDARVGNFQIVSITLDPEFDTPGVLNTYAKERGIDTSNFTFLTGPEQAIKDLMTQLGVLAFKDGPLVKHTLATVLINEDGKIVYRQEGSQWQPTEFAKRLHPSTATVSS